MRWWLVCLRGLFVGWLSLLFFRVPFRILFFRDEAAFRLVPVKITRAPRVKNLFTHCSGYKMTHQNVLTNNCYIYLKKIKKNIFQNWDITVRERINVVWMIALNYPRIANSIFILLSPSSNCTAFLVYCLSMLQPKNNIYV